MGENENTTALVQVSQQAVSADRHGYVEALIRSEIQARTALALARPRDLMDARSKLLTDAKRPGFADSAEWKQTRWDARKGREVELTGPSIRFAEACKRALGNIVSSVHVITETEEYRILRVQVDDLESNDSDSQDILVEKTMERRRLRDGDEPLSRRTTSDGATIYTIRCPDQELLLRSNALVSRALRNLILRFVPGDIQDDVLAECRRTRAAEIAADPDAAVRKIADSFSFDLRVQPSELARYLGHPIDRCSPAEIDDLRQLYRAIRDGQTTWQEVIGELERTPAPSATLSADAVARVREAAKGPRAAQDAPAATRAGPTPAAPVDGPSTASKG